MATFANVAVTPPGGGLLYASATPLTTTEADLCNTAIQDPIAVPWLQSIDAVVQLVVTGAPVGQLTYVVMQTDMGDGVWIDVAWIVYTNNQAAATFVLSSGQGGANAFQQVRNAGSPPTPQSNGSNNMVLGSRVRFVGKASLTGGSSGTPGMFLGVTATIRYRLLALR